MMNCVTYTETLKSWLYVMISISALINTISIGLIIASIVYVRRLSRMSKLIRARLVDFKEILFFSTRWLIRGAIRVSIGDKAKAALISYASTIPELAHLCHQGQPLTAQ